MIFEQEGLLEGLGSTLSMHTHLPDTKSMSGTGYAQHFAILSAVFFLISRANLGLGFGLGF